MARKGNLPLTFGLVLAGFYLVEKGGHLFGANLSNTSAPATPSGTVSGGSNRAVVDSAAKKWGVPSWIMWGIYGMETDFGRNVATSSAGAEGSFQFIASTAKSYNYPYTNATDPNTFAAQADAAGHLLHDLFIQTGSWASAIEHYSGGGYTLSSVQSKSQSA